jgi:hypothetical protein
MAAIVPVRGNHLLRCRQAAEVAEDSKQEETKHGPDADVEEAGSPLLSAWARIRRSSQLSDWFSAMSSLPSVTYNTDPPFSPSSPSPSPTPQHHADQKRREYYHNIHASDVNYVMFPVTARGSRLTPRSMLCPKAMKPKILI